MVALANNRRISVTLCECECQFFPGGRGGVAVDGIEGVY